MPANPSSLVKAGCLTGTLPEGFEAAELFDTLVRAPGFHIERIVSTGQSTPDGAWFDQASDEFVVLVAGAARLQIDGEPGERMLEPGDWLLLPARCRHRVTWTQGSPPTIWLAIHFGAVPESA